MIACCPGGPRAAVELGFVADQLAGTWVDANPSMLLYPDSCNYVGA